MFLSLVTASTGLAGADFSAPVRIPTGSYYEIDATADNDGDVHAVARGNTGLWYITDSSGTWTRERLTTFPPDHTDRDPSIAVDSADNAYIVYESRWCDDCAPGGNDGIAMLTNASGDFPDTPTMISNQSSVDPSIAVRSGNLYISYARCDCLPFQPTAPVFLWTDASGSPTRTKIRDHGTNTSLFVNGAGKPRVAFQDAGIRYAVASTMIGGWTVTKIPGTNASDVRPDLDVAGQEPWIAYTGDDGTWLAFRVCCPGAWTSEPITAARGMTDLIVSPAHHYVALDRSSGGVFVKDSDYSDKISSAATARDVAITARSGGEVVVLFSVGSGIPQGVYVSHD
jgi:hypothetical protein